MTTSLGTSNVRTSLKSTRTNPSRTSKTIGSSLRLNPLRVSSTSGVPTTTQQHGFYPAITHFTDAIAALPRELRRHTSLLKEVDAKAWAPEANLQTLLAACAEPETPPSVQANQAGANSELSVIGNGTDMPSGDSPSVDTLQDPHVCPSSSVRAQDESQRLMEHRKLLYSLRATLSKMMVSMDEKNHLISGANDDLCRHLTRLKTIYPHLAGEVSEEARLGSLTHWAYVDNKMPTGMNPATNARREAAAGSASTHDTEIASRSETRREAMLARKLRQQPIESDLDDARLAAKRQNAHGKGKKTGDAHVDPVAGLGITGVVPAPKRKRTEKGAILAMKGTATATKRAPSQEPAQQEPSKKRKAPAASGSVVARKRYECQSGASAAFSPFPSCLFSSSAF